MGSSSATTSTCSSYVAKFANSNMLPNLPRRKLSSQDRPVQASPQDQSSLFSALPIEIRLRIYQQIWMEGGLTQHIFALSPQSFLQSFPCILSPEELGQQPVVRPSSVADAEEDNQQHQWQSHDDPGDIDSAIQDLTLEDTAVYNPPSHPWCMHSSCFSRWLGKWGSSYSRLYHASYKKRYTGRRWPDLRPSPTVALLLVCKRVHWEASDSLFSSMRFSFFSMNAVNMFLEHVPRPLVSRIQFVDVRCRFLLYPARFPGFLVTVQSFKC